MLVLSRKLNEEIVIAGNVRIKVTEICGNRVRLAVSAPDDVRVIRGETEAVNPAKSYNISDYQKKQQAALKTA